MKMMRVMGRACRGIGLIESFRIFGASCGCFKNRIRIESGTSRHQWHRSPARRPAKNLARILENQKRRGKKRHGNHPKNKLKIHRQRILKI